jgi:hypothetical protein
MINAPSHDPQTGLRFLFKVRPVFVVAHVSTAVGQQQRLIINIRSTQSAVELLATVAAAATMEENGGREDTGA